MSAVADVLDRAADRIERDGLARGEFYPGRKPGDGAVAEYVRAHNPPCCAFAALLAEEPDGEWLAGGALDAAQSVSGSSAHFVEWSDATSQPEVVATLREAARRERERADR